jgi:RsiW-degrading membrane proteinase PrsW (M82 family)
MSTSQTESSAGTEIANGAGGAAVLAAGIGSAVLGILSFAGDASGAIGKALNVYNPTGSLSGVTTLTIIIWLVSWLILHRLWNRRTINLAGISVASFVMLGVGFLLTFPPFMDLLQGK